MKLKGLDPECVDLCKAMNRVPGIHTFESCSGHGETSYHIFFDSKDVASLPPLLYWFDGCHCGFYGWKVFVTTDCGMSPAHFTLEGPVGTGAYEQSKKIAKLINNYMNGVHGDD